MDDALFTAIDNITEDKASTTDINPDILIEQSEKFKSTKPETEESKEIDDSEDSDKKETESVEDKKPWKIDEHGKKISTMVPKERFDEKNNLAKDLEAKLKERDRKLFEIEERSKQALDLSKFDLNNYEKPEDWAKEVMIEIRRQTKEDAIQEIEQQKIVEKVRTAEENLIKGFDQNIEETAKEIPDIVNVVSEFAKYKEYLPRETIYTIMGDENSAKVIHEIMTTENMLRNLSEMSPVQAARVIGKLSAKMDLQKEYSENNTQSRSENVREIPSTPIPQKPIPQKPKGAGSPNLKGASDKSVVREESNSRVISKKESEEFAKLFSSR